VAANETTGNPVPEQGQSTYPCYYEHTTEITGSWRRAVYAFCAMRTIVVAVSIVAVDNPAG